MKKRLYNLLALGFGIFISLLLAEIVLRFYNPFQSRIRGNEIVLPANVKYEFKDVKIHGLKSHIKHTKNSMGFRGAELNTVNNNFRIFCVGGSTTECFYLNDGQDWPSILGTKLYDKHKNIWINNAGLDGHSTRGHIILLRDHLLKYKPNMVVFLVGCNDVAGDGLNEYEQYHLQNKKRFLENFELFNAWLSWKRSRAASQMGLGHKPVDFKNWEVADTSQWASVWFQYTKGGTRVARLTSFSQRLDTLAHMCFTAGAIPVFITQPTMLSNSVDPISGRYLGNLKFQNASALHYRAVLNLYNQQTMQMEAKYPGKCYAIDAANQLETTLINYYDFFHYTIEGSRKMAAIVYQELIKKGVLK